MASLAPLNIPATDKLRLLRRLDRFRKWEALDDKRQCIQCGEIISGREIEIVGGTRQSGPLRLQCPTENCRSIPMDWILPNDNLARPAATDDREKNTSNGTGKSWFRRLLRSRN